MGNERVLDELGKGGCLVNSGVLDATDEPRRKVNVELLLLGRGFVRHHPTMLAS